MGSPERMEALWCGCDELDQCPGQSGGWQSPDNVGAKVEGRLGFSRYTGSRNRSQAKERGVTTGAGDWCHGSPRSTGPELSNRGVGAELGIIQSSEWFLTV